MSVKLKQAKTLKSEQHLAIIIHDASEAADHYRSEAEQQYVEKKIKDKSSLITLNHYARMLFLIHIPEDKMAGQRREFCRRKGYELANLLRKEKLDKLQLSAVHEEGQAVLDVAEGLLLSLYNFDKYRAAKKEEPTRLKSVSVFHPELKKKAVQELENIVTATCYARDLVNEPANALNAEKLSQSLKKTGKEAGFKVEVLGKDKIKALKMGGLLAVNIGSVDPPTFNVLEYKPDNAKNKQPFVLVGKGVTYDTGGLSLKPSNAMLGMKADMGGAAAVAGTMLAVAKNKLPVHLVGLIPATDNRPGGNAIAPGDVITISDGSTVEVLNTDAEGRLILADALVYAKKYKPALVIDLATLTGAALMAIGKEGIAMMGTASSVSLQDLQKSGEETYERLVEFPLWDEYGEYLKSDIADLKNIGGRTAGVITAGMFLKHFTDYPWIHLDIAGTAYLEATDNYRGKNGTGAGVRLLYQYLKTMTQ